MSDLKTIATQNRALLCMECGKCTSVCPVSVFNEGFSPRVMVTRSIRRSTGDVIADKNIWACLTCGMCELRCPANITYLKLTQGIRHVAQKAGERAICSHGGAAQSIMRIMASSDRPQRRTDWIDDDLEVAETGKVAYFVGCLPHLDILLGDIGVHTLEESRAAIRIMNHFDIVPAVLPQERCCGHDLLWSGDIENFKKLARHNIDEIKKSQAERVVFSCPEGYRTFKLDYPKYYPVDFEVLHISELMGEALDQGKLHFKEMHARVTYQDPCRLSRHLGIYDAPRRIMNAIPGVQLVEMSRNRQRALCCGVSAWIDCSACSKQIQLARLREAKNTGAEQLILACPKCEIHFRCVMKEKNVLPDVKIPTRQFSAFVAQALDT